MKNSCLSALFALSTLLGFAAQAQEIAESLECVSVPLVNFPQRMPLEDRETHEEGWCYLEQGGSSPLRFIFKWQDSAIEPEHAALLGVDSDGAIVRLTHAALYQSELTWSNRLGGTLNPLPVPLSLAEAILAGGSIDEDLADSARASRGSIDEMMRKFVTRSEERERDSKVTEIQEGTFESLLPVSKQPWIGFWWPFSGSPLSSGEDAPLAKFDRFVEARTGTNPGSAEWEDEHHSLTDVEWGGHCNGWAGSTMLYAEPTQPVRDPETGIVFRSSDLKGVLAEASFCTNYAFFGERNDGDGDERDIYPHVFHEVLTYYIDTLKKPIALDYRPDAWVDNHIASGYRMTITRTGDHQFHVTVRLRMHGYNNDWDDETGTAETYGLYYGYTLTTNENGEPIGGQWDNSSDNPDFMWVSTGQTLCGGENPYISTKQVKAILALPPQ